MNKNLFSFLYLHVNSKNTFNKSCRSVVDGPQKFFIYVVYIIYYKFSTYALNKLITLLVICFSEIRCKKQKLVFFAILKTRLPSLKGESICFDFGRWRQTRNWTSLKICSYNFLLHVLKNIRFQSKIVLALFLLYVLCTS